MSSFRLLSELAPNEKDEIASFCLRFIQGENPENLLTAIYILGDLAHFPQQFEVSVYRRQNRIKALLLRREPIYMPLGFKKPVFQLISEQMNQENYFIRIPPSWRATFTENFVFSDEMHNITFGMKESENFIPAEPPNELKVRKATREDIPALARYYDRNPKGLLATIKTHPRALGMLEGRVVSVARANVVSQGYAILGGVHTLSKYRNRGYGKAVVSVWTEEILRRKLQPILETDIENYPALAIYRALGYPEIGKNFYYEAGSSVISGLRSRE
ncbi:MAG: GNAT family N-acetyltransferase [Candidatus Thorarchaeota archaeon]